MKEEFEKEARTVSFATNKQSGYRSGAKKEYWPYIVRRNWARLAQEDVIPGAVDMPTIPFHAELNPDFWTNGKLKKSVRSALLKIAKSFYEYLKIDAKIKDIHFTGSLANYSYTTKSDVDMHIMLNLDSYDDKEFIQEYLIAKKSLWNDKHNILIKGFEVEVFAKDEEGLFEGKGIYSLLVDKWIQEPSKEKYEIDEESIKVKSAELMNEIDGLEDIKSDGRRAEKADKIKKKIRNYRDAGLEEGGEFSVENLVFKTLRREGYMDKLSDVETASFDKSLSVQEKQSLNENHSVLCEGVKDKYDYSCLMLNFNISNWDELSQKINPDDVYDEEENFGLESEPHTTVLYGLHDEVTLKDVQNAVEEVLAEGEKVRVMLTKISIFENPKYDVLKFDIDSPGLTELNKRVRKFPHTSDFPDYHPHMTIAYLKRGRGKNYVKELKQPIVIYSGTFSYSVPSGEKTFFALGSPENILGVEKGIENMTPEKIELIKKFINFTVNRLEMKNPVSVYLHKGRDEYISTTASYDPNDDTNHIRAGGRATVDICKSIGHELAHNAQLEKGVFSLGDEVQNVGGHIEDQANAIAGILIKDFAINCGNDKIYDF